MLQKGWMWYFFCANIDVNVGFSFNPRWIKEQNSSTVFFTCAQVLFLISNALCSVCVYMHTVAIWNCLRNSVCVSSIWVPFHVCLLFVWFFSAYRKQSLLNVSAQNSPTFPNLSGLVLLFLHLSSLLLILNCTCLIYLYFKSKFLTSLKF